MISLSPHPTTWRWALRIGALIGVGFVSLGALCVSPSPPLDSDPHFCGGALAQDPDHAVVCDHCVAVVDADAGQPCTPNLCDPSATAARCHPGKGLRCDPATMACVSGQRLDEACGADQPCSEEYYCFQGSSTCAQVSPSDPWSILHQGSPPPDRCLPYVPTGGTCDSTWDSPGCLPCTPGLTCDAADHTCKRACSGDADCPSSGSHCVAGFCGACIDPGGVCSATGLGCCDSADQCTNGTCCRPRGTACSADADCCAGNACVSGTCSACGGPGQPCCGGAQCGTGTVCNGGSCAACGGAGEPCCGGSQCGGGLVCSGNTCAPCGSQSELCCAGNTCGDPSTVCSPTGRCDQCGNTGEACCAGAHCNGSSACQGGRCVACGGAAGEPCCNGACSAPLVCNGGQCATCGLQGGPCCAGGSCAAGNNVCAGGICQPCGQTFEACCAGGGCAEDANQARICVNNICSPCGNDGQSCCFGDTGCSGNLACCSAFHECKEASFCP